jgi:hypothetical protein
MVVNRTGAHGYGANALVNRRARICACTWSFSIEDHLCLQHVKEKYMSSFDTATENRTIGNHAQAPAPARRVSTETKASFKTTELIAYVAAVIAVLIASAIADGDTGFGAKDAWFFITLLTIGYMVSRGLAKSGSRDFYDDGR